MAARAAAIEAIGAWKAVSDTRLVLSMDGGGVTCAAAVAFLAQLETALRARFGAAARLTDVFDLFAGTSAGALALGAVVFGGRSAREVQDEFFAPALLGELMPPPGWVGRLLGPAQTRPLFDGAGKRAVLERWVGADTRFSSAPARLLVPWFDATAGEPRLSRSWAARDPLAEAPAAAVLGASSAAPGYFPAVEVDCGGEMGVRQGIDGAVFANNPASLAYAEALQLFGEAADLRVLTLGAGEAPLSRALLPDDAGGLQWASSGHLLRLTRRANEQLVDTHLRLLVPVLGHRYLRVQGPIADGSLTNISPANIADLKARGEAWWREGRVDVERLLLERLPARDVSRLLCTASDALGDRRRRVWRLRPSPAAPRGSPPPPPPAADPPLLLLQPLPLPRGG
jgi:predicted acylesterase/phospholipase RssA